MAAPTLTTQYIASVTSTGAIANGNVSSDGSQTITERGVVVSTSANPTISDTKFTKTGTTGVFTVAITGLTQNITYHCRAYATNAGGTSYGADIVFHTSFSLADVASHTASLTNQAAHSATLTDIPL